MSDRYREYGRQVAEETVRQLATAAGFECEDVIRGAKGTALFEHILDSIEPPAPTQAESYDAPTGPGWWWAFIPSTQKTEARWELVRVARDMHCAYAPGGRWKLPSISRWVGPLQPPGTTTPDVQAPPWTQIGALLDQWEQLPNDVAHDPDLDGVREAIKALTAVVEATPDVQAQVDAAVAAERERWQAAIENHLACQAPAMTFMAEVATWVDTPPWEKIRARSAQEKGEGNAQS